MRTFFRYFSGKRHVLFGDVAFERITPAAPPLDSRPAGEDPLESVRAVLDASDFTDPQELEQIGLRMRLMRDSRPGADLSHDHPGAAPGGGRVRRASAAGCRPSIPYPLLVSAAAAAAWDVALHAWAAGPPGHARRPAPGGLRSAGQRDFPDCDVVGGDRLAGSQKLLIACSFGVARSAQEACCWPPRSPR